MLRLRESPQKGGTWGWLLQRFTAALLLFALGAHLWALHLVEGARDINFEGVTRRVGSPFFIALDAVLIGLALYHGLYGLRSVIFDFVAGSAGRKVISWGLTLLGLIAFIIALRTLLVFLG